MYSFYTQRQKHISNDNSDFVDLPIITALKRPLFCVEREHVFRTVGWYGAGTYLKVVFFCTKVQCNGKLAKKSLQAKHTFGGTTTSLEEEKNPKTIFMCNFW